jgi:hypothetical protein
MKTFCPATGSAVLPRVRSESEPVGPVTRTEARASLRGLSPTTWGSRCSPRSRLSLFFAIVQRSRSKDSAITTLRASPTRPICCFGASFPIATASSSRRPGRSFWSPPPGRSADARRTPCT